MNTIANTTEESSAIGPTRAYAAFLRRFNALIIDTIVLVVVFFVLVLLITLIESNAAGAIGVGLLVATLFLYDPVLVSARCGTIGHYKMNMRVVDQESGRRIGLLRAVLRSWIKMVFGLFSFVFMLITRRHQALHDVITKSAVVIHNVAAAEPHHYLLERPAGFVATSVPIWRRVLAIIAFSAASFVLYSIVSAFVISLDCLNFNRCTPSDNLAATIIGALIFATFAIFIVLGWKGRLWGARDAAPRLHDSADTDDKRNHPGHM